MTVKKTGARKTTQAVRSTITGTTAKKPATKQKMAAAGSNGKKAAVTPQQRHQLISEAAYYLSMQHGDTVENSSIDNWLRAEQNIDEKYRVSAE